MQVSSRCPSPRLCTYTSNQRQVKHTSSDIADMRNNGNKPRLGGSGVAAQFLHNFIENDTPWVHMDIAGTAWTEEAFPTKPKGATAFGVRLLDRMVQDYFEQ
ncbi:hypothetical protein [Endozoicomonas sp. SCSIO W0465]|uniref:hypothetical protein n=1 Tax=Endozoicomonas sp. SCSIO W0465 TaxID=2918516 RepID=UPI0021120DB0|nr:hypothetical protein [Endozoicomonas sp. SCSIO W0465]